MNEEEIIVTLSGILSDILGEEVSLSAASTAQDIEGWDSLVQMTFMLLTEKTWDIELSMKEISSFKNVGELARIIAEKKGA